MHPLSRTALLLAPLLLVACGKKAPDTTAPPTLPTPAPVAAPAAPAPSAEPSDEQRAQAEKQKALEYATMEDQYINDPRAQWASTASASSTFGDPAPSDSNLPKNATGKVDGDDWLNNNQTIGFDTLELGYEKPVAATEVRVVVPSGEGIEAISKVELQDTEGKWNVIWSGVPDAKRDDRGPRSWYVRSFEKTPYKVKAVKYTFANNLYHGYKKVDAAQLIGD
ncbi:hypothetical protein [Massilia sp. CF038]|uniref:hypothetical protein n=1 Tax=Massilia sp. CF038 TaxID=1881045 RepID=UPI00091411CF|nr:hypothetical protein [Massilia sp. CF038]SHH17696.1 hypothetical protein SAMN05428948_3163 [Massilia sp. CF038]